MPKQPLKKPLKKQTTTPKASTRTKLVPIPPKPNFEGLMLSLVVITLVLVYFCTWFVDLSDGSIDPNNHLFYTPLVTALGGTMFYMQYKANKDTPQGK